MSTDNPTGRSRRPNPRHQTLPKQGFASADMQAVKLANGHSGRDIDYRILTTSDVAEYGKQLVRLRRLRKRVNGELLRLYDPKVESIFVEVEEEPDEDVDLITTEIRQNGWYVERRHVERKGKTTPALMIRHVSRKASKSGSKT